MGFRCGGVVRGHLSPVTAAAECTSTTTIVSPMRRHSKKSLRGHLGFRRNALMLFTVSRLAVGNVDDDDDDGVLESAQWGCRCHTREGNCILAG